MRYDRWDLLCKADDLNTYISQLQLKINWIIKVNYVRNNFEHSLYESKTYTNIYNVYIKYVNTKNKI